MRVIKRDGTEAIFNKSKIVIAINKAMRECNVNDDNNVAIQIADYIEGRGFNEINVEDIQDIIEAKLMATKYKEVAKAYIRYRYDREKIRNENTTDGTIMSLVELTNETIKQENSNKNPTVLPTQRDYMAGEVSKDITRRKLLPKDIVEAHDNGLIHFHDSDYFIQHMHNCDVWNLEDMLQNGTMISGVMIEKPHSFSTACNIATQIMAQVASSQYGGQTITLTHLAPFVDISRQKIKKEVANELYGCGLISEYDENLFEVTTIAEKRLREEIRRGVQTIQYQILTLQTSNGQTPFVSLFMYLNEAKDDRTKSDLALIIEEILLQRHKGVKNEKGVWITPAFPKLLYVLEEDNITEDSKYWYLTELAAKCTAKRMVPDYISEKIMLENKIDENGNGNCYPCINKNCA